METEPETGSLPSNSIGAISNPHYVLSSWGKRHIAMEGFVYRKDKVNRNISYWNCVLRRAKFKCKSRIHVLEDGADEPTVLREIEFHNHRATDSEERLVIGKMKEKAIQSDEPIRKIVDSVLLEVSVTMSETAHRKIKARLKHARSQKYTSFSNSLNSDEGRRGESCFADRPFPEAQYVLSNVGNKLIAIGGYLYRPHRDSKEKTYWTCILGAKCSCKSRLHVLKTDEEKPVISREMGIHNHPPDLDYVNEKFSATKFEKKSITIYQKRKNKKSSAKKFSYNETDVRGRRYPKKGLEDSSLMNQELDDVHEVILDQVEGQDLVVEQDVDNTDVVEDVSMNTRIEVIVNDLTDTSPRQTPYQEVREGSLHGRVVLITDATSEIGEAISRTLASGGASVCLTSDCYNKLWSLRGSIEEEGGDAHEFVLDVTNHEQFSAIVSAIEERLGPVDILINNAAVMCRSNMQSAKVVEWDKMISVNCRGVTNAIAAVLPGMVERREGWIFNTSSDAGKRPLPGIAVYSGTKFFVEGMSEALRQEVKDKGIKVVCVQLGDSSVELTGADTSHHDRLQESTAAAVLPGRRLDAHRVAQLVLYMLTQPPHITLNEIAIEPCGVPS